LVKVHGYATRRRLEANYTRHKGEPMDVIEMDNYQYLEEEQWEEWQLGDVDAFDKAKGKGSKGKGKGKGKGVFQGQCYNCGQFGHSAKFCPQGKSKGKGKETRQCYACGQSGHLAWQCPKGTGKAGNLNFGAKGKGQMWELANVNQAVVESHSNQAVGNEELPVWMSIWEERGTIQSDRCPGTIRTGQW